jgi:hypothetical protein
VDHFREIRRSKMKKLSVAVLTLSVATLGIPVLMHGNPQDTSQNQDEKKPKLIDIEGTVKADGDKITFIADDGGKSWDVVNPEVLKDHVGHHVELSAHVYPDKGQIHVMKVTML